MRRTVLVFVITTIVLLALPNFAVLAVQPAAPVVRAQGRPPTDAVPQLVMPSVDNAKELEAYQKAPDDAPVRFAVPIKTTIDTAKEGVWDTLGGELARWRLRIRSAGALSLNFGFTRFRMPHGGQLTVFGLTSGDLVGPYTDADNESHGQLWTPLVLGEEALVQVIVPAAARGQLVLDLTSVNHGFLDPFDPPLKSGSCNVDVACSQSEPWRLQVGSVARILIGGAGLCTGALINNTANDRKPYFLTADHCGVNGAEAPSVVSYWNYANTTCRVPGSVESGQPGNGSLAQTLSGAFFRADYSASDMTLLELDDPVPANYNPYWAGWDRGGANATSAIAIHHPRGNEKRISFENDPTAASSYGGGLPNNGTHVRVIDWDLGTTEPGSSGSPLFDQNGRIIGQLHGGGAACGNDLSDYYGRFFTSWTGGGSNATRLSNWLDPLGTGQATLDGIGAAGFNLSASPVSANVCTSSGSTSTTITIARTGDASAITFTASGAPAGAAVSFAPNPVGAGGSTSTLTVGNLAAVATGSYPIIITGSGSSGTSTTTFPLTVSAGPPGVPTLITPANNAADTPSRPTFTWSSAGPGVSYLVQVATDAAFTNVVASTTTTELSFTPTSNLDQETAYFWRVRPSNTCGAGATSAVGQFRTALEPGFCPLGQDALTLFADDFESGAGAWTTGGTSNTWEIVSTRTFAGTGAFRATGVGQVSDQYLVSPPVAIPAAATAGRPTLQFQNYQWLESGNNGCYDGAMLEISTDNGGTWTQVGNDRLQTDPYDGALASGTSNPLAGRQAWCGDPQNWLNSVVDLQEYAGQTVRFRFRVATDSSVGREGWTIDNVRVQACRAGTAPAFTSPAPGGAVAGLPFTHTFVASGNPAPSFAITAGTLPGWLSLNGVSGVLAGTPPAAGSFGPFTVTASNGVNPPATQAFTLVVRENDGPPAFISPLPPSGFVGRAYSHRFIASGNPAPSFVITAGTLPGWLSLNGASGVLAGTPPAAGSFGPFTVTASNGVNPPATQTFTIEVEQTLYLPALRR